MRLFSRLCLLILACLAPVVVAQVLCQLTRHQYDAAILIPALLLGILLAGIVGWRLVLRPIQDLLITTRRSGESGASTPQQRSEFASLARSCAGMAATLSAQEKQIKQLEARLAERTGVLSESNNRLQVAIAEHAKIEATLHQAQKMQAVGQVAGGIAHDFNNMLATILGSLELMERRVGGLQQWTAADADRLGKLIERATGAVQRAAQLTSRLLAFSRRQRVAARPSDLNQLINDLVILAGSTLGRRVRVVADLADDLWPAMVDVSQIEVAILHLCLNARDAMPDGGQLTISSSNELFETPLRPDDPSPGPYVRISVADTGMGMSPDVLQRAREPFFTTKGSAASGLGLSQVHSIVRQSGGAVRIETAPGDGTQVSLLLPRASEAIQPGSDARPAVELRRNLPSNLVLVVDDDHAVRQVTVEMLKDLGCDTAQASGGNEALGLIDEMRRSPDLILLDYAMPGMNGLQLARTLRAQGIAAPMALVTGYAELAEAEGGSGVLDALLRKPFTIRELDATLARLRRRARSDPKVVSLRG